MIKENIELAYRRRTDVVHGRDFDFNPIYTLIPDFEDYLRARSIEIRITPSYRLEWPADHLLLQCSLLSCGRGIFLPSLGL